MSHRSKHRPPRRTVASTPACAAPGAPPLCSGAMVGGHPQTIEYQRKHADNLLVVVVLHKNFNIVRYY